MFTEENFIHVPGFAVVRLGLSGNELLCYSLIYGFTQDGETEFSGSLSYIASALNVTRQNAKKILDRLIEQGLIIKKEIYLSGVKFCHYVASSNGVAESATGGVIKTVTGGVAESATHNNINNNNSDNIDSTLFDSEAIIVTRPKRTSEALCLFENSRYSTFEEFAKCFETEEFRDIDLVYYFHAVADWSASKGAKKRDWIATARNFIRGDMEKGKVRRKEQAEGLSQDAIEYLKLGWHE